jgi:hypothetical protein
LGQGWYIPFSLLPPFSLFRNFPSLLEFSSLIPSVPISVIQIFFSLGPPSEFLGIPSAVQFFFPSNNSVQNDPEEVEKVKREHQNKILEDIFMKVFRDRPQSVFDVSIEDLTTAVISYCMEVSAKN